MYEDLYFSIRYSLHSSIEVCLFCTMYADVRVRHIYHPYLVRPTIFYPRYTSGLDYVSYVSPVERVDFQKVLPRYYLSSSQTRDSGLGPSFEEIPYFSPIEEEKEGAARRRPAREQPHFPYKNSFKECIKDWHIDVLV